MNLNCVKRVITASHSRPQTLSYWASYVEGGILAISVQFTKDSKTVEHTNNFETGPIFLLQKQLLELLESGSKHVINV